MKIEINTKEDSHEEIRKVIRMLQHIVGDSGEVFTNQPQEESSPMSNIFGDAGGASQSSSPASEPPDTAQAAEPKTESSDDIFAELFSEEELKKMDAASPKSKEEEEDEEVETKPKSKDKKYGIEFY